MTEEDFNLDFSSSNIIPDDNKEVTLKNHLSHLFPTLIDKIEVFPQSMLIYVKEKTVKDKEGESYASRLEKLIDKKLENKNVGNNISISAGTDGQEKNRSIINIQAKSSEEFKKFIVEVLTWKKPDEEKVGAYLENKCINSSIVIIDVKITKDQIEISTQLDQGQALQASVLKELSIEKSDDIYIITDKLKNESKVYINNPLKNQLILKVNQSKFDSLASTRFASPLTNSYISDTTKNPSADLEQSPKNLSDEEDLKNYFTNVFKDTLFTSIRQWPGKNGKLEICIQKNLENSNKNTNRNSNWQEYIRRTFTTNLNLTPTQAQKVLKINFTSQNGTDIATIDILDREKITEFLRLARNALKPKNTMPASSASPTNVYNPNSPIGEVINISNQFGGQNSPDRKKDPTINISFENSQRLAIKNPRQPENETTLLNYLKREISAVTVLNNGIKVTKEEIEISVDESEIPGNGNVYGNILVDALLLELNKKYVLDLDNIRKDILITSGKQKETSTVSIRNSTLIACLIAEINMPTTTSAPKPPPQSSHTSNTTNNYPPPSQQPPSSTTPIFNPQQFATGFNNMWNVLTRPGGLGLFAPSKPPQNAEWTKTAISTFNANSGAFAQKLNALLNIKTAINVMANTSNTYDPSMGITYDVTKIHVAVRANDAIQFRKSLADYIKGNIATNLTLEEINNNITQTEPQNGCVGISIPYHPHYNFRDFIVGEVNKINNKIDEGFVFISK